MFISQLVLYFVDYLLVLLNTMCIYPCFFAIQHTLHRHPPHIVGFRSKPRFGGGCYLTSAMYGETLARYTCAVYPLDYS
jgi:hypothetical protein